MQDWKCGSCDAKLTHTFEIDHKIRLEHGGGNDVSNLIAMCRECHGQKQHVKICKVYQSKSVLNPLILQSLNLDILRG